MGGGGGAPDRNYYAETADTLRAQVDLAPKRYAAEAAFRPQYNALELRSLNDSLFGTAAGTEQLPYTEYVPGPQKIVGYNTGMGAMGGQRIPIYAPGDLVPVTRYRTVDRPAQEGLLSMYENKLAPAAQRIEAAQLSAQRGAEVADVEKYGSQATAAFRNANPDQAALLDELNRQARSELELGATLDPSLRREVQQGVRGAQAARGFGYGQNDAVQEALFTGLQAEQLRRTRQQFAQGMVGVNAATTVDPFMAILGRPASQRSDQFLGQGAGLQGGPRLFNPESQYSQDIYDSNFNARNARGIAGSNGSAAMIGAGIGGVATIGAALL